MSHRNSAGAAAGAAVGAAAEPSAWTYAGLLAPPRALWLAALAFGALGCARPLCPLGEDCLTVQVTSNAACGLRPPSEGLPDDLPFASLSCGLRVTCGLDADGEAFCAGPSVDGEGSVDLTPPAGGRPSLAGRAASRGPINLKPRGCMQEDHACQDPSPVR